MARPKKEQKEKTIDSVCEAALDKFKKMNKRKGTHGEIIEKLEFCIGSYRYDKNPQGLVEFGHKASEILKGEKARHDKSVAQGLIDDLDSAISAHTNA
ncbi:hypothetical protein FUAX_10890 [Fulvitalea axinellae]|uniref:Uncharacterized protein n=1 Tax=Fulvitalea axinellae TaxID=1182444 RepID=A0AAU9CNY7_9BACT|nr:hypothetical protein FUAX_10890 [Fulvitalea axinellae]